MKEKINNRLTRAEKETIILFSEDDEEATIFTYLKSWQNHLEKKLGLKPVFDNGFGGKEYKVDKSRIKPPRKKKNSKGRFIKGEKNGKAKSTKRSP